MGRKGFMFHYANLDMAPTKFPPDQVDLTKEIPDDLIHLGCVPQFKMCSHSCRHLTPPLYSPAG